ncbi:unnamed protein product [Effrenium voratum]|nr:unnamed protein product [Effrenium voratum]
MPGKGFSQSSDSRTTEKHVFKPPESGGTVSESRAERWQNASAKPKAEPKKAKAKPKAKSRSRSPSPKRSASPSRGPKGQAARSGSPLQEPAPPAPRKPMAKEKLDLKKVFPPSEMVAQLEDRWYTHDPLLPLPGRHGPTDFAPRMQMSHPPGNNKVRKDLLLYLYARKVKVPRRARSTKREEAEQSPSPSRSQPEGPAPSRSGRRTKSKGSTKSASLPLLMEQITASSDGPTEEQVRNQSEILRQNSRYLGWEIANRHINDLTDLAVCHNQILRRHAPLASMSPKASAGRLRELRVCMQDHCLEQPVTPPSPASTARSFRPKPVPLFQDTGPLTREASPQRLRRLARQLQTAGPGRVQLMARAVGLNVATGGARTGAFD